MTAQKSGKAALVKLVIFSLFSLTIPILLIAPQSESQSPVKLKTEDEAYRQYKIVLSRQLGVTCSACHNTLDFSSDEKLAFKVAKDHMKLTQLLIDHGMDGQKGRPKADCYLCHRGKLKPDYKEPTHPMLNDRPNPKKEKSPSTTDEEDLKSEKDKN
ncbi:MAG: hypothetical protein BroJett040_00380 [Oligoflexia bacterium]|nr:MAG: hypothetical protein BroJett040_00380 [Oligoflexia bacterium]